MSFINVILNILMLLIVPLLIGNCLCELFKIDKSFGNYYVYGMFGLWAFFQLITVPLVLFRASFNTVVIIVSIFIVALAIYGLILNHDFKIDFKKYKTKEKVFILCFVIFALCFMFLNFKYQHIDEDDSRFVVNAVDILETNKMFLTNPATGEELPGFVISDSDKDVVSPFAVYIAYIAKMTFTSVAITAHTVLPLALIVLSICVFFLVADKLLGSDCVLKIMFVTMMLVIILFGYSYFWTMITMYIGRLWQGKSIIASIGIPALFTALFDYYDNYSAITKVIIIDMGMCLLSGMGIVIGAVIIGCFALGYWFSKKDIKAMLYLIIPAIINTIYFLLEINI